MYKGCTPGYYDVKDILSSVNQEELFYHYLGILPNSRGRFKSPLRPDRNPGCRFAWHSGILYLVENSMYKGKLYWSIFDCLKEIYGISFNNAVEIIALDYKIDNNIILKDKSVTIKNKPRPEIRFTYTDWKNNLFNLSNEILEQEHTYLVDNYWIGRNGSFKQNNIHNPKDTLTVAYHFPESNHVKLYFPNIPKGDTRWYSNCDIYDIFGYDKIDFYYDRDPELLIITKSQKDRLILDYHLGYNAIALQNEGCSIPLEKLSKINRFKRKIIIFDNDATGIRAANKISNQYGFEYIIFNDFKDIYEGYINNKTIKI